MGEQLEIQWLAGVPYLVQSDESTNWEPVPVEITPMQYAACPYDCFVM